MKNFITYLIGLIVILIYLSLTSLILGFPLMWLWNYIFPGLFGLAKIGYWESVGIILISNILFKGSYNISKND